MNLYADILMLDKFNLSVDSISKFIHVLNTSIKGFDYSKNKNSLLEYFYVIILRQQNCYI